jgi:hypothetical protein
MTTEPQSSRRLSIFFLSVLRRLRREPADSPGIIPLTHIRRQARRADLADRADEVADPESDFLTGR